MKSYKLIKGFYSEKSEIELNLPEDLKWAEVHPEGAYFTGQVAYITIIEKKNNEDIVNQHWLAHYNFGKYYILRLDPVDVCDELPQCSLDELNARYNLSVNTSLRINKHFEIEFIAIPKRINNMGEMICDAISLQTLGGRKTKNIFIDENLSIANICGDTEITSLTRGTYCNDSKRFKEIYYSILFKWFDCMCKPQELHKYIDKNINENYMAELGKELEEPEIKKVGDSVVIIGGMGNRKIIMNIKEWLGITDS